MFWFHCAPSGAPLSMATPRRVLQSVASTTSLSVSICVESAPVSQNLVTAGRTRDIALKARSTSMG